MTTHVVGGDGAGRVALDQLDPSGDAAEDELLLGPEHAAWRSNSGQHASGTQDMLTLLQEYNKQKKLGK